MYWSTYMWDVDAQYGAAKQVLGTIKTVYEGITLNVQ